tara:strand:+ start:972 stop:1355 length:384 start_codon:yes stop_codon:yes gene_type:complete
MNDIKPGTNKGFGIVFFIVFFLISIYPLIYGKKLIIWSLIISFVFLVLALFKPGLLAPLNKLWFRFGILLGKVISPLLMGIIFFFMVTPIGFLMKILKKDLLNLKFNRDKSYWIENKGPKSKMKNQF